MTFSLKYDSHPYRLCGSIYSQAGEAASDGLALPWTEPEPDRLSSLPEAKIGKNHFSFINDNDRTNF